MKKLLLSTAAIAVMGLSAGAAHAVGSTDSATATASATVVEPIEIANDGNMSFGAFTLVDNASEGSVTTANVYSNTIEVPNPSADPAPAQFIVTGQAGFAYNLTVPTIVTLEGPTAADNMDAALSATGYEDLSGGSDTIVVAGTLGVAAAQAPGSYLGTMTVTVEYQ